MKTHCILICERCGCEYCDFCSDFEGENAVCSNHCEMQYLEREEARKAERPDSHPQWLEDVGYERRDEVGA